MIRSMPRACISWMRSISCPRVFVKFPASAPGSIQAAVAVAGDRYRPPLSTIVRGDAPEATFEPDARSWATYRSASGRNTPWASRWLHRGPTSRSPHASISTPA